MPVQGKVDGLFRTDRHAVQTEFAAITELWKSRFIPAGGHVDISDRTGPFACGTAGAEGAVSGDAEFPLVPAGEQQCDDQGVYEEHQVGEKRRSSPSASSIDEFAREGLSSVYSPAYDGVVPVPAFLSPGEVHRHADLHSADGPVALLSQQRSEGAHYPA